MGWITVAVIVGVLLGASIYLVRRTTRRWWDFPIIAVLTVVLVPILCTYVTGDISAWVSVGWSEGHDGTGEIILASAASSIVLPLALAAGSLVAINAATGCMRTGRRS